MLPEIIIASQKVIKIYFSHDKIRAKRLLGNYNGEKGIAVGGFHDNDPVRANDCTHVQLHGWRRKMGAVGVRGRREKRAGGACEKRKRRESPTKRGRRMNMRQKAERRREADRGGGTEDNKCQNNDPVVAGRTAGRIVGHRGQNSHRDTPIFGICLPKERRRHIARTV